MRWSCCLTLLVSLGCGSAATLNTQHEGLATLTGRSTYAFADGPGLQEQGFTTGHLFNPIMRRRIEDELSKELAARGYVAGPPETASMLVTFSGGSRQDVVTQGDQKGSTVKGTAYTVDRGALVLHFLDPQSRAVLWRGWGDGVIQSDDDLDQKVRSAVHQIMAPFPKHVAGEVSHHAEN